MKKHILPLTYKPKIRGIKNGTIKQTIRLGSKFKVGDCVMFHGWGGKPYRSKWSFRIPYTVITEILDCCIYNWGIVIIGKGDYKWSELDWLAEMDGIEPPTGEELKRVLFELNDIVQDDYHGTHAQIIRWS